jgi:hypothetical protein
MWTGQGPMMGIHVHGNEPSGFIKGGEFFEQLRNC